MTEEQAREVMRIFGTQYTQNTRFSERNVDLFPQERIYDIIENLMLHFRDDPEKAISCGVRPHDAQHIWTRLFANPALYQEICTRQELYRIYDIALGNLVDVANKTLEDALNERLS